MSSVEKEKIYSSSNNNGHIEDLNKIEDPEMPNSMIMGSEM